MLQFESKVALRHLRSGGWQTVLTVSAVAVGVVVVVFISSLIIGVQQRITTLLTDVMPNVTVTVPDEIPQPLYRAPGESRPGVVTSRIERQSQRRVDIQDWPHAIEVIRAIPHVVTVVPTVTGQGIVSRGGQRLGAQVFGAEPEVLNGVLPVTKYMVDGHYLGLRSDEVVISYQLSQDLGVTVGGRVRVISSEGRSDSFLVAGIYDTGQERSIGSRAYLPLRAAQSLFGTGTAVRTMLVRTDNLYAAEGVARRIRALLPLKAESWSEQNPQVLASLTAQNAVRALLSGFSLIASAFAIASVLIVSVVQRSREIGILKSMGAKPRQILGIFLLEGLGIALVGAVLGAALGVALVLFLTQFRQPVTRVAAEPELLFPGVIVGGVLFAAMAAAVVSTVLAAVLPARRAAALNPVEVIR